MSKGEGLKIGIKFTEDLVGDVTGSKNAFTITGKEYQYVNGNLIDGNYQVEKVERYPIQRVWELGGQLQLDEPGEMSITDSQYYEVASGTTLTGTVQANAGDIVIATIARRSTLTIPLGWVKLYESTDIGTANQTMVIATKKIDTIGLVSYTATQATSGRLYLNLISISGIDDIVFAPELESIYRSGVKPAPMPNKQVGDKIVWGATVSLYQTSPPYGGWSTNPNDLMIIHLDQAITTPRLANLIDFGNGQAINRTINHSESTTGTDVNIAGFKLIQNYTTPKIHTTQTMPLSGEYKLNWLEDKPIDTNIVIEYTTGQTQGQWQEVSNGDIITSDTNLWIRATLSTEDTAITPILQDLWLEEASAPQDKILITLDWWGKINNAEDKITIAYDATKGSLTGAGGAVESFEVSFNPLDLIQTPNPNAEELILAYPYEILLELKDIEYINAYAKDDTNLIKAYPYEIVLDLKDVSEINP